MPDLALFPIVSVPSLYYIYRQCQIHNRKSIFDNLVHLSPTSLFESPQKRHNTKFCVKEMKEKSVLILFS